MLYHLYPKVKSSSFCQKFKSNFLVCTENVLCDVVNLFVGSENLLKVHLILSLGLSSSKELLVPSRCTPHLFAKYFENAISPDCDAWPAWWLAWAGTMCCNRESTQWRPWPHWPLRCRRGPTWPLLHQVSPGEAEPEETRREVTLTATTHQLQSRAKSQTGNNCSQQPSASLTTTSANARWEIESADMK